MTSPIAAAANELCPVILDGLAGERGIHAETAVAAAARMSGTFLLRSLGLPIDKLEPGSPVFSDAANEKGPHLISVYASTLRHLDVTFDPEDTAALTATAAPLLTVLETQQLLEGPLTDVVRRHGLSYEQAAEACAMTAARITQLCSSALDPDASFGIASLGFVEGSKTVPFRTTTDAR